MGIGPPDDWGERGRLVVVELGSVVAGGVDVDVGVGVGVAPGVKSGAGGPGSPTKCLPPSVVRTIDVQMVRGHGEVPSSQCTLGEIEVNETGVKPAGTGPPGGGDGLVFGGRVVVVGGCVVVVELGAGGLVVVELGAGGLVVVVVVELGAGGLVVVVVVELGAEAAVVDVAGTEFVGEVVVVGRVVADPPVADGLPELHAASTTDSTATRPSALRRLPGRRRGTRISLPARQRP